MPGQIPGFGDDRFSFHLGREFPPTAVRSNRISFFQNHSGFIEDRHRTLVIPMLSVAWGPYLRSIFLIPIPALPTGLDIHKWLAPANPRC
jgi:hypothetical protein